MTHLQHLRQLASALLAILLLSQTLPAQQNPPAIEWEKSLGGSDNDGATSIEQTSDGGYIVAGLSYSNDGDVTGHHGASDKSDYWIVKLTGAGVIQWEKSLGGSGVDYASSIEQTSDGGYIVAGSSYSTDGDVISHFRAWVESDYWIVKLTNAGDIQWEKSLGGSGNDYAASIEQTSDGGYIVAGWSSSTEGDVTGHHGTHYKSDYWIVKLTSAGDIQWQKSLGGSDDDAATSIEQTSDGGYIVAGESASKDGDVTGRDVFSTWIVKLTDAGVIQWNKSLNGQSPKSIQQTNDGGYIVANYAFSSSGGGNDINYQIIKLMSTGLIQWQKSLGGGRADAATSIEQTSDGGYIVAGLSSSNDGDVTGHHGASDKSDYWIVKLTSTGDIQWEKSLGGSGVDYANSIVQTSDRGCVVAGWSLSNNGDVTGHHGSSDSSDYWIVKLGPITSDVQPEPTANLSPLTILPNPAHTTAMLNIQSPAEAEYTIELISPLGEVLKRQSAQLGLGEQTVPLTNLESLPAGSYEVIVSGGGKQVARGRLVLLGE
ncbi:MAG: T9SS C-terminal target domain-containing protein [Chlorobi bacterium]|nr:T9SS C-terminal target domain-containing protein [Chlorobiota bacterium]